MNGKLFGTGVAAAILAGCTVGAEVKDGDKPAYSIKGGRGTYSQHERSVDQTGKESYSDKVIVVGGEGKTADFLGVKDLSSRHEFLQEDIRRNSGYAASEVLRALEKSIEGLKSQKEKYESEIKALNEKATKGNADAAELDKTKKALEAKMKEYETLQKELAEKEGKYKSSLESVQKALEELQKK